MIWLFAYFVLALLVTVLLVKVCAVVRHKFVHYEEPSILDFIMDFPKSCAVLLCAVIIAVLYFISHSISGMYDCEMRSLSHHVDTQYSWYYDECRFKNDHGVWVPFKNLRGTADGEDGSN